jgi:hypothetical protein
MAMMVTSNDVMVETEAADVTFGRVGSGSAEIRLRPLHRPIGRSERSTADSKMGDAKSKSMI